MIRGAISAVSSVPLSSRPAPVPDRTNRRADCLQGHGAIDTQRFFLVAQELHQRGDRGSRGGSHVGEDACRGVADLLLMDDSIEALLPAIREGRTVYENLRKAVHYIAATNSSELLMMFTCVAVMVRARSDATKAATSPTSASVAARPSSVLPTIDSTMAQDFPSLFPHDPGVRAYFGPTNNSSTDVQINAPTTLGMLDINRRGINIGGNSTLTFDTQANNAVLFNRKTHNFTVSEATVMEVPVTLSKSLEVVNDSPNPVIFNSPVGGGGGMIKNGFGPAELGAANTYTGGTVVNAGFLNVTAPGGLGPGSVTLNGGVLGINTINPFQGVGTINVNSNSQINVGGNATWNSDNALKPAGSLLSNM